MKDGSPRLAIGELERRGMSSKWISSRSGTSTNAQHARELSRQEIREELEDGKERVRKVGRVV
jgi:hypothetical protein